MVQGLNGTVMRLWNYDSTQMYFDGEVADSNGVTYLDIVRYPANSATGGAYYRLKPAGRTGAANPSVPTNSEYWEEFSTPADSAAFQAIIAKYGFIENLTGREIVVTNSDNTPVAGITNGTAVDGDGDAISGVNRGNVRIWAGTPAANGNLADCPFYVTDGGFLHAENGEFGGTVSGVTGSFKSLRCVDNNNADVGGISFGEREVILDGDITHNGMVDGRKGLFDSLNFSAHNIGTGARNTIIIEESGNKNTKSKVIYISGGLAYSYTPTTHDYSSYISYDIPLLGTSVAANAPSYILQALANVWWDTVIIIAKSGSGYISYNFTQPSLGKRIRVINTSYSTEAYIAIDSTGKARLYPGTSVDLTYVGNYKSTNTNSEGAGWFHCGSELGLS